MTTKRLIRKVESAAYRSWPAGEVVEYDGWQLRYSDGFSRRGNSAYPASPSTLEYGVKLSWCADWYRQRGLQLVVRQNPATEPGLDNVLADLGYGFEGRTNVMVASLDETVADEPLPPAPTSDWWAAMSDLWEIGPDRADGWRAIIERIDLPAAYGIKTQDGVNTAAGLAVVDEDLLGLFEVIVAPAHRRQGIGRTFTRSLMGWGRQQGATRAYLQVVAENAAAISMYEQLGFETAYSYWYRRAP